MINNNSITECKQVFIVAVWIVYDRPPSQGDDKAARGVTGTFRFNQSNQRRSWFDESSIQQQGTSAWQWETDGWMVGARVPK